MITLHVSYSKKIPAETEYSSKQFHASLEVEVADEIAQDGRKLQEKLRALWKDLQDAVETQIRESGNPGNSGPARPDNDSPRSNNQDSDAASQKQVNYLMLLARRARGWGLPQLQDFVKERIGNVGLYELSKRDASMLIEEFRAMKPAEDSGIGGKR